jgi:regulator of protease activity HflC (stomatin/prohibitin superfamily)
MIKKLLIPVFALFALQSCTVVRPGEVGVKQRMGKLSNEITTQGPALFNPFTSKIIRLLFKQMI